MGNILHQLEREEDDANLAHLRSEVERLRLTDAEREALTVFAGLAWTMLRWSEVERHAATLRGLLERTAQ